MCGRERAGSREVGESEQQRARRKGATDKRREGRAPCCLSLPHDVKISAAKGRIIIFFMIVFILFLLFDFISADIDILDPGQAEVYPVDLRIYDCLLFIIQFIKVFRCSY